MSELIKNRTAFKSYFTTAKISFTSIKVSVAITSYLV